jgi:hypothetical protein
VGCRAGGCANFRGVIKKLQEENTQLKAHIKKLQDHLLFRGDQEKVQDHHKVVESVTSEEKVESPTDHKDQPFVVGNLDTIHVTNPTLHVPDNGVEDGKSPGTENSPGGYFRIGPKPQQPFDIDVTFVNLFKMGQDGTLRDLK